MNHVARHVPTDPEDGNWVRDIILILVTALLTWTVDHLEVVHFAFEGTARR